MIKTINTEDKLLEHKKLSTYNDKKYQSPILIAFLLLLFGISIAIHNFKVPPIMNYVSTAVGLSQKNQSWLMSSFLLVCLIFSIPAGAVVNKLSSKTVMLLSAVLVIIGSSIGAIANNVGVLVFSRIIEGLGFLLASVAIPVTAIKYASPTKVGLVVGISSVWISSAQIVAFNSAPYMIQVLSWHSIWWVYTLFTVLVLIIFLLLFKGKFKYPKPPLAENKPSTYSFIDAFKNKNLLFASYGFFVFNFALMVMITFFPVFVAEHNLMTINKAGFIASLPMILSLISAPFWGKMADKLGHKWLYLASISCSCIGVLLMFVASSSIIIFGAVLLGFSGMASPTLIFSSLTKLVFNPQLIAQSNGVVMLFQNAGMFFATFIFSILNVFLNENYLLSTTILLVPLGIIAGLLILLTNYEKSKSI